MFFFFYILGILGWFPILLAVVSFFPKVGLNILRKLNDRFMPIDEEDTTQLFLMLFIYYHGLLFYLILIIEIIIRVLNGYNF